jgi:plastocyanin
LWLAAAVAVFAVMAYAGLALAASPPIIGQIDDTYSAPTYTIDQGEVAQLQVTGSDHNVNARTNGPDGGALFLSPTITSGSAPVQGTQYLSAGDYQFFCTIHPTTMQATLHVSANGTPQARPTATLKVRTKTISKALKKGLIVSVNTSVGADQVALVAKLGKATLGKGTSHQVDPGSSAQTATIKLTKAGKSKLRSKKTAKVTVTGNIAFGSPATAKAKLK